MKDVLKAEFRRDLVRLVLSDDDCTLELEQWSYEHERWETVYKRSQTTPILIVATDTDKARNTHE